MIRELHLTHLYVTRYIHLKGGKRAKIQKLSRCISIIGKIDLKKIIRMKKNSDADGSRGAKVSIYLVDRLRNAHDRWHRKFPLSYLIV